MRIRYAARTSAFLLVIAFVGAGCANFEFDRYDDFDSWYVGREHPFDESTHTAGYDELSWQGYLIDDVLIRMPLWIGYDLGRLAAIPVALPVYAFRSKGAAETETTWLPYGEAGPARPAELDANPER